MTASRLREMLLIANCLLSLTTVIAWHAVRLATSSPAPTVKIRWKDTVSEREREGLEREFQLANAERIAPMSFNYDLIDSRAPVIQAIVEHPAVGDTGDLDPRRFTVATSTEPGETRRWLWHRRWRQDAAMRVSVALHAWLAASAILWGMRRYTAAGEVANRTIAQTLPR